MRVPLPASHPMLARPGPDGSEATPYSHFDNHDAPTPPPKRSRRPPWLTVLAVLAVFALLVAYHEELRRALSVAEDELRDGSGAISLESARDLKQSLRDITTRLSQSDRDQLGALVDAAIPTAGGGTDGAGDDDVTRDVTQAMDTGASLGFGAHAGKGSAARSDDCGASCMDALASRLPRNGKRGGDGPVTGLGKYDVGDERRYRQSKQASDSQLKGAFMKSQVRKMHEAVQRGWADLKKGKLSDARTELKQAREFHSSELRLMRGSPKIAQYLGTPKEIRQLRDGIDESQGSIKRTPSRLAKIADHPRTERVHSRSARRTYSMPKKLKEIMEKQFTAADDNLRPDSLKRISRHFQRGRYEDSGSGSSAAWTSGGTSGVTLPRSAGRHRHHDDAVNGDFNKLALEAIERGRADVNAGMYTDARKALSKARMFLSSLKDAQARENRDARRRGSDAVPRGDVREVAAIEKLQLEYSILEHAVTNLGEQRRRTERKQLDKNLRVLHAPIRGESLADYASRDTDADAATSKARRTDRRFEDTRYAQKGARIRGDRVLFSSSIRRGVEKAEEGEIARAQAKLVEARYYARRDGLLRDDAELTSRQRHNGRVAKRALKLLARDIVKAEERLQDPVRSDGQRHHRFSLSSIMGLRSSRSRRAGAEGRERREGRERGRSEEGERGGVSDSSRGGGGGGKTDWGGSVFCVSPHDVPKCHARMMCLHDVHAAWLVRVPMREYGAPLTLPLRTPALAHMRTIARRDATGPRPQVGRGGLEQRFFLRPKCWGP